MKRPAIRTTLLATLFAAPLLLPLGGCNSNKPSGEQKDQLIELHKEMALGYYRMGELDRAEGQALKGLELAPKDDMLQLILAWTLQRKGSTQDVLRAEAIFKDLPQDDYRAVLGWAQALERKGQAYDEAGAAILAGERETEAEDPEQRAAELTAQARTTWQEAVGKYERTLELHPEDRDALNGLQRVHALLEQYEASLARSEELVELIEAEVAFWEERLQAADLTASEEQRFLQLVIDGRELQLGSYLQQASVLRALGRRQEEIKRLTLAADIDPSRPDLYGRRAQAYMELEDFDAALRDIDEFLRLTPGDFDHPDTRMAHQLQTVCQERLAAETP